MSETTKNNLEEMVSNLFFSCFQTYPQEMERCSIGIGNLVYIVKCTDEMYVLRCSQEDSYADTIHWLQELRKLDVPVPEVLHHGIYEEYHYLILSYLPGKDIGVVYNDLSKAQKQTIAKDVMQIQRRVKDLPMSHIEDGWSWVQIVDELLDRAVDRISENGYFDVEKVQKVRSLKGYFEAYFAGIKPVAYLDDISTKNLLIQDGNVSGVIDVDWMGEGDDLTFIAMTYVALLNMECETDYVDYLLEERGCSDLERRAFWFYSLMYCVDFMGERGMQFGDKKVEVNEGIVGRLNWIYEMLWERWEGENRK